SLAATAGTLRPADAALTNHVSVPLSSAEPEAHVVSTPFRLGVVLECRSVVQNPAVVDEQHLARLQRELHAQAPVARPGVEGIEGADRLRRKGKLGFLVPRFDPVAKITDHQSASALAEDREAGRRLVPGSQSAATVDVEGSMEDLPRLGVLRPQLLLDRI